MNWLKEEVTGFWRVLFFVSRCLVMECLYSAFILVVLCYLGVNMPDINREIPIFTISFLPMLFILAFTEEVFFRLPLVLVVKVKSNYLVIVVAFVLSALFGFLHGGFWNIFIQGFSGLIFSVAFFKSGAFQGKIIKPLIISTAMHFVSNLIIVGIIVMKGGTSI